MAIRHTSRSSCDKLLKYSLNLTLVPLGFVEAQSRSHTPLDKVSTIRGKKEFNETHCTVCAVEGRKRLPLGGFFVRPTGCLLALPLPGSAAVSSKIVVTVVVSSGVVVASAVDSSWVMVASGAGVGGLGSVVAAVLVTAAESPRGMS